MLRKPGSAPSASRKAWTSAENKNDKTMTEQGDAEVMGFVGALPE
jgi:hypothetical protein